MACPMIIATTLLIAMVTHVHTKTKLSPQEPVLSDTSCTHAIEIPILVRPAPPPCCGLQVSFFLQLCAWQGHVVMPPYGLAIMAMRTYVSCLTIPFVGEMIEYTPTSILGKAIKFCVASLKCGRARAKTMPFCAPHRSWSPCNAVIAGQIISYDMSSITCYCLSRGGGRRCPQLTKTCPGARGHIHVYEWAQETPRLVAFLARKSQVC